MRAPLSSEDKKARYSILYRDVSGLHFVVRRMLKIFSFYTGTAVKSQFSPMSDVRYGLAIIPTVSDKMAFGAIAIPVGTCYNHFIFLKKFSLAIAHLGNNEANAYRAERGGRMGIIQIELKNFTVFSNLNLHLTDGLNVLIGENGTGKTHVMKLIYSACKAVKPDVSFSQKVVRVFRPDQFSISRLARRQGKGNVDAEVKVSSDSAFISMTFSKSLTKKWDADVKNERKWEQQHGDLTCTFIPAKEILSNAWNLEAAVGSSNVEFDDTYVDIVMAAKIDLAKGADTAQRKRYLSILQKVTDGRVTFEKDRFYLWPGNAKIEFNLVAEGIRKVALLWQLIKNGTLEKGSILLWDEPEANLNPKHLPMIAEMLLELQRNGVQVFVATHDYFLAKFIEIYRSDSDQVAFHSMYVQDVDTFVESKNHFAELEHNPISDTYLRVYKEEIDKAMEVT